MGTRQIRIIVTQAGGATAITASRVEWLNKGRVPEATDISWVDVGALDLNSLLLEDICADIADLLRPSDPDM